MDNQNPLSEKIKSWLLTHSQFQEASIELLLGDGSTRSFYRITDRRKAESAILISDPQWAQTQDYPSHQRALKEAGISVPEFLAVDEKSGFLLMEDLGDTSLQKALQDHPEKKQALLEQAVQMLAKLHSQLFPVSPNLPASKRRFDEKKLFEECLFTLEHLRKTYLKLPDLSSEKQESVLELCQKIAAVTPLVFCHRDYHCRNLFIKNNSLFMIDFQDARLGPPSYDLASLLFDAYFPLESALRNSLVKEYQKLSATPLSYFELTAYQRVFKAAGSFASFFTRYQKPQHLQYIKPALLLLKEIEETGLISKDLTDGFEVDLLLERLKGIES